MAECQLVSQLAPLAGLDVESLDALVQLGLLGLLIRAQLVSQLIRVQLVLLD